MKTFKTLILLIVFSFSIHPSSVFSVTPDEAKYKVNATLDRNSPTGLYIPKDIPDALVELKKMLTPEFIAEIKSLQHEDDMVQYHFVFGMWMRNNWGLWGGSRLKNYFKEMGLFHPDDMSSIILTSLWRDLNGKPLEIEKQVAEYKKYWKKAAREEKPSFEDCNIDPELRQLEKMDPAKEAKANLRKKDTRFLGVYGLTLSAPGITRNPHCLKDAGQLRALQDTSDAHRCAEHGRLQMVARKYVEVYNKTIDEALPDDLKKACTPR